MIKEFSMYFISLQEARYFDNNHGQTLQEVWKAMPLLAAGISFKSDPGKYNIASVCGLLITQA